MFKYADPSKLPGSLLEGHEDHLLSQARSELMKQEYQWASVTSLRSRNGITGRSSWIFFESRREPSRLQEE